MNYDVKYAILDSTKIINLLCPFYLYKNGQAYIDEMNKSCNFYSNLEKDILKYGFKNPILVTYGTPKYKNLNLPIAFYCEILGGSRLYIAQKNKLQIPVLISDFTFSLKYKVLSKKEILYKCTYEITDVLFEKYGIKLIPSNKLINEIQTINKHSYNITNNIILNK